MDGLGPHFLLANGLNRWYRWYWDRHKMWVGILENKNVGYKSICMSGI